MNTFLRESCSGAKNFFPLPNAIFSLGLSHTLCFVRTGSRISAGQATKLLALPLA